MPENPGVPEGCYQVTGIFNNVTGALAVVPGSWYLQPRRYGALKSVDPTTGEIRASVKMTYPNYGGVLATAGNLVFIGQLDGTFVATKFVNTSSSCCQPSGVWPTCLVAGGFGSPSLVPVTWSAVRSPDPP